MRTEPGAPPSGFPQRVEAHMTQELQHYSFNINPETEMGPIPTRLWVLRESDLITKAELGQMIEILMMMVRQAVREHDLNAWAMRSDENPIGFTAEEIWSGTPAKIAHEFKSDHYICSAKFKDEIAKEDPEHHRLVEESHRELEDPGFIGRVMAMLEQHGIIVPCEDPLRSRGLKGSLNLKDKEKNKDYKGKPNLNLKDPPGGLKGGLADCTSSNQFLSVEARDALEQAGTDPDLIRFFDAWPGYATALNAHDPARGGVKGMIEVWKRKGKIQGLFADWLAKHPATDLDSIPKDNL